MKRSIPVIFEYGVISLGSVFYALGFAVFVHPNHISPGGVTGIATIINQFFDFVPIGLTTIVINLPLLIIGFIKFKLGFVLKTAFATVLSSVLIDTFLGLISPYTSDRLLACLASGVLVGAGLGIVMLKGGTTGGTDIVAKLINRKYKFLSLGRLILLVDTVIVSIAALIYGELESLLYSALFLFVSGTVMDRLIYGSDTGKIIYVVTDAAEIIINAIFNDIGRGVTKIKAVGGYTDEDKNMLMCVARAHEVSKIIHTVKSNDVNAFVVISDAGEVLGQGFKNLN